MVECRRLGVIPVGLALWLTASPALAGQWKVTLEHITVAPTKANGQPWDADGSPPDVFGDFAVGRLSEGRCVPSNAEKITKHQNMAEFATDISVVVDAEAVGVLCFAARFMDKDLAADDPIGAGVAALQAGTYTYRFGQAEVQVSTRSSEAPQPTPANEDSTELRAPPSPRPLVYKVSVVTARIHQTKPDGATWDAPTDKEADDDKALSGLLGIGLAYATGGTTAIVQAGASMLKSGGSGQVSYKAQTASAPDPQVVLRWGGLTFATPKNRNTFQPRWAFEFLVPAQIAEHKPLRIDVLDADDGDDETIGSDSVSGKEVVKDDVFRRTFGGVEELVIEIEKVSEESTPTEKTLKIDTTRGWVDTGIDVVAGQTIHVTARGQHCLRGGRCVGPDGENLVAFQRHEQKAGVVGPVRVGQLAAVIGDDVVPIGSAASITAKASGRLLLGVASKASSGSLTAQVQVFYPLHGQ